VTIVLMLGPTGAGKGTQAAALASFCEVPHISTGDIFRANIQAETPMGKLAGNALRAGELVPDSVTQAMLAERLHHSDTKDGFVLDGFPRTTGQATWLDAMLTGGSDVTAVIVLSAPDEVLLGRARRRGRVDDTAPAITRRLAIYRERTKPLLGYYGNLVTVIDAARDTELVHEDIVRTIQTRITYA
jgi:adenylate kinase